MPRCRRARSVFTSSVCPSARRSGHTLRSGGAAGARVVLHHDRLVPPRREPLGDETGDDVRATAGPERLDQPHCPAGKGSRARHRRQASLVADSERRAARQELLDSLAEAVDQIALRARCRRRGLRAARRVRRRPAGGAALPAGPGRLRPRQRTHAEFAERHRLPAREFAPVSPRPGLPGAQAPDRARRRVGPRRRRPHRRPAGFDDAGASTATRSCRTGSRGPTDARRRAAAARGSSSGPSGASRARVIWAGMSEEQLDVEVAPEEEPPPEIDPEVAGPPRGGARARAQVRRPGAARRGRCRSSASTTALARRGRAHGAR